MTASPATTPPARPAPIGALRGWLGLYLAYMRLAIAVQLQYRVANYFYMIGMVAEPVIYLVVWSTVATQQGGQVGGFTPGDFAAYYIVWTLVRNMNIVFTPWGWEQRIREGELSGLLLRPLHPLHHDVAFFAGWKFVVILLWLPLAALLTLVFRPTLDLEPLDVAVFGVAIWGAYLIRMINQWTLGLVTFWTTRVGPVFDIWFTAELLLSGRLVPLALVPPWVRTIADVLPFKWTFGFPIEALVADLTTDQLLFGLGMQVFWIVIGLVVMRTAFRIAVRRYAAVGG